MPYQVEDVDKHKKGLSDDEKKQWVEVANSVYDKCIEDGGDDASCAVQSIKQANGITDESNSLKSDSFEVRTISDYELRMESDSRIVFGDAIVFNRESKLIYEEGELFYEMIKPEAMAGIIEKSDIFVWLNHDKNRGLLARSKNGSGSLKLEPSDVAVKFSFEAPRFALGDELVENIRRGDIKGTSFSFRVAQGGEKWQRRLDGTLLRTITKFDKIGDISPVYDPAYADTSVALRHLKTSTIETEVIEVKPVTEDVPAPFIEIISEIDPVVKWYRDKQKHF
jgi:hypothetical protein